MGNYHCGFGIKGTVTPVTNSAPGLDFAGLSIWAVVAGKIVHHYIPYNPSAISTFMFYLDKQSSLIVNGSGGRCGDDRVS